MTDITRGSGNVLEDLGLENADELLEEARSKCLCSLRTKLVGDGCQYCNPKLAEELSNADVFADYLTDNTKD